MKDHYKQQAYLILVVIFLVAALLSSVFTVAALLLGSQHVSRAKDANYAIWACIGASCLIASCIAATASWTQYWSTRTIEPESKTCETLVLTVEGEDAEQQDWDAFIADIYSHDTTAIDTSERWEPDPTWRDDLN